MKLPIYCLQRPWKTKYAITGNLFGGLHKAPPNSIMIHKEGNYKMAKGTQRLKPDTVLKNYWKDNGRFADLFNAALFDGRQVIKPEELEDLDTEASSILEHRKHAESITASRDNIKARKFSAAHGVEFVLLGAESQGHVHYAMPMRVMGYDYNAYKKQYDSNAQKYKTRGGIGQDEYLSKMKKDDKFIPVITLTVYYGEKPWDGATSLHGMLNIPEGMRKFVNDYKMPLVEARKNNLTFHNIRNINFFNMMEVVLDPSLPKKQAKEKAIAYAREHNVDKTVVMTVAGAANINIDYNAFEKGDGDMCTLFDEIAKEGEAKGEAKGIIESGLDFNLSENDILERLQKKLNIPLQKAQEYFNTFGKQMA